MYILFCIYIKVGYAFYLGSEKSESNLAKHGISFELASKVFDDPLALSRQERVVAGEERWHTLGSVGSLNIILVAHAYRDEENGEEIVRIISARMATKHERRAYEQGQI